MMRQIARPVGRGATDVLPRRYGIRADGLAPPRRGDRSSMDVGLRRGILE